MNSVETFQHYQLSRHEDGALHELGRGAMGITYKAFDTNLRCHVALKVVNGLYLHSDLARTRFIREARAAAALRHRNVASVYHLGGEGDRFFYAMEFIDGENVETWVRRAGRLPVVTALRVALQAVRALGAAAKQKLLHRDIKPANLMVVHEDDDEHFVVKLIDFGLARSLFSGEGSSHPPSATVGGGFVGTPMFASPEQLQELELDARADIYSLGITLWFMLAGRPPFTGTLPRLFDQHVAQEPPWDQLAGLPAPVLALLAHMLQKDPAQRPQSPAELRVELADCLRMALASDPEAGSFEADDEDLSQSAKALPPSGSSVGTVTPKTTPLTPAPGMLLSNRFRLARLVGEGRSGQVFQAHDLWQNGRAAALKILHPEFALNAADYDRLKESVARVRSAPHPNLLKLLTLERYLSFTYLTQEWAEGFTLVGLLRKRGTLTVVECLALLKQAVAAADHARAHGLPGLEFGLHQILVHFPGGLNPDDAVGQSIFRAPLTEWPEFALKLDALGAVHEAGALATWAGEITLVNPPGWCGAEAPAGAAGGAVALDSGSGADSAALGLLAFELLSGRGVPPPASGESPAEHQPDRDARQITLPILGETGNEVLRRCFSPEPGFANGGDFFATLARAVGFDPADLRPLARSPGSARASHAGAEFAGSVPFAEPAGETEAGASLPPLSGTGPGTVALSGPALESSRRWTRAALRVAGAETDAGDLRPRLAFRLRAMRRTLGRTATHLGSGFSSGRLRPVLARHRRLALLASVLPALCLLAWLLWPNPRPLTPLPAAVAAASVLAVPVKPAAVRSPEQSAPAPAVEPGSPTRASSPQPAAPAAHDEPPDAATDRALTLQGPVERDGAGESFVSLNLSPVEQDKLWPPSLPNPLPDLPAGPENNAPAAVDGASEVTEPAPPEVLTGNPPGVAAVAAIATTAPAPISEPAPAANAENADSPAEKSSAQKRKKSPTRAKRRQPPPRPDFWQRVFGIKPKR